MGILAWIQSIAQGKSSSLNEFKTDNAAKLVHKQDQDTADDDSVMYGLNFQQAIEAHQQWKLRLNNYIEEKSSENLDPNIICRDDKCVLGIWIHTSGKEHFGQIPLYQDIKETHAQFHTIAGDIVSRKQSGDAKGSRDLLHSGLYTKLSVSLQTMLANLYLKERK